MSYLENLINDIDSTHKNLGQLVAVCQVAIKARKFALIVSPSGCGKSKAMSYTGKHIRNNWMPTSLSISSLANKIEKLTSFRSVIVIDDLATIQTAYSRETTITTLSALCYTHFVAPSMVGFDFELTDFYGSALVGVQPIILRDLMIAPEWDASIQDKALRYYHLYRPLSPTASNPKALIKEGKISIDDVEDFIPDIKDQNWINLINLGLTQWSISRAREHMMDFLKAVAALEDRKRVTEADYIFLYKLLRPMALESIATRREQLEGENIFDNSLMALLAEYYTYGGEFLLGNVARDFKNISAQQAYKIMLQQNGNWQQFGKSPTIYRPSEKLYKLLKAYGLEVEK